MLLHYIYEKLKASLVHLFLWPPLSLNQRKGSARSAPVACQARPEADPMATEEDQVISQAKAPVEAEPSKAAAASEPQSEEPKQEPQQQRRVYKNIVTRYVCIA